MALGEATARLRHRVKQTAEEISRTERRKEQLDQEVCALDNWQQELGDQVKALNERLRLGQVRLGEVQGDLNRADALAGMGFGDEELRRLYEMVSHTAASQGLPPQEGVTQFFSTVERYEQVVSFDLETLRAEQNAARARAEAERWEAEARRAEAKTKLRTSSIDLAEKLLSRAVKVQDLPRWEKVLAKAGLTVEQFSEVDPKIRTGG